MDRKELEQKVIEFVATAYKKDLAEVTLETKFGEDLDGSSRQMIALMSLIENDLEAVVPMREASASKTVKELVDRVEENL